MTTDTTQETTQSDSRFLSRKFLATVFTLLSATVLVAFRFIDGGVYSAVIIATNSAYLVANVIQKNNESTAK